jgi:hypothetical protein
MWSPATGFLTLLLDPAIRLVFSPRLASFTCFPRRRSSWPVTGEARDSEKGAAKRRSPAGEAVTTSKGADANKTAQNIARCRMVTGVDSDTGR